MPSQSYNLFELVSTWATKRKYEAPSRSRSSRRLMVIGGEDSELKYSTIEYYCPRFNKWIYWKNLPDGRKNFATVVVANELYIIGGELNGEYLRSVREIKIQTYN